MRRIAHSFRRVFNYGQQFGDILKRCYFTMKNEEELNISLKLTHFCVTSIHLQRLELGDLLERKNKYFLSRFANIYSEVNIYNLVRTISTRIWSIIHHAKAFSGKISAYDRKDHGPRSPWEERDAMVLVFTTPNNEGGRKEIYITKRTFGRKALGRMDIWTKDIQPKRQKALFQSAWLEQWYAYMIIPRHR